MASTISQLITEMYFTFSKAQKKIANEVLNKYDKVAYMTAAKLAKTAGVSESTVVRFALELGYDGYSAFQHAIQELVRSQLTLNQRIEVTKERIGSADVLGSVVESDIAKLRYTLDTVDREAFLKSVDSILNAKTIYVLGARSAQCLAYFMQYSLGLIFDNVRFIQPTSTGEVFEQLFPVSEGDVVIAYSFPRYSAKMINAVKYSSQQKANVIVITDSKASPLADYATHLLTAQSDMVSFTDSLVAPLSITNAIIVEITNRRGDAITDRFNRMESIFTEYNVYAKNDKSE